MIDRILRSDALALHPVHAVNTGKNVFAVRPALQYEKLT